jgi:hypothetical protein
MKDRIDMANDIFEIPDNKAFAKRLVVSLSVTVFSAMLIALALAIAGLVTLSWYMGL